jgi:DNA-directed RNA polymerase subunit F
MKKTFVLIVLFVLPIVAYLFFASGVNNFGKLPELTKNVGELNFVDGVKLNNKITVLGFLGSDVDFRKGNAFNLNQKIYKRFHEFKDFQFVMVVPKGTEDKVEELKEELASLADIEKWNFVFADTDDIESLFASLKTDLQLDASLGTPYVFIVDKDRNLRGRTKDEDEGTKYGFNSSSVADLNNKMEDDVKIILAEYRLALKKNNADRTN